MTQFSDYTSDPVCRICGVLYSEHLQCRCCTIYCGPNHFLEEVILYRGKELCDLCIEAWIHFEKVDGHEVAWGAFSGRNKYYRLNGQRRKKRVR